jgi:uncharacterized coiled-coil protein SlyX
MANVQQLEKRISALEAALKNSKAEVARLNKLIDTRYKSNAKPAASKSSTAGQNLAIQKLKEQNARLTNKIQELSGENGSLHKALMKQKTPVSIKPSSTKSLKAALKSIDETLHGTTLNAPKRKELAKVMWGATFEPSSASRFKVGDRVQALTGRRTNVGVFPKQVEGVIIKRNGKVTCDIRTEKYGVWRLQYDIVRKF